MNIQYDIKGMNIPAETKDVLFRIERAAKSNIGSIKKIGVSWKKGR